MNPYNNYSKILDKAKRDLRNERDANRALAETAKKDQFTKPTVEDWELFDPHCELNDWTLED